MRGSSLAFFVALAMLVVASWSMRRSKRKRRKIGPAPVLMIVFAVALLVFVVVDVLVR